MVVRSERGQAAVDEAGIGEPGHSRQVTIDLELLQMVTTSIEAAEANGYPQLPLTDYEIAIDIGTYDADLEGREPEELMPYIAEWRKSKEVECRLEPR